MDARTFILNQTVLQNELKEAIYWRNSLTVKAILKKGADPNWRLRHTYHGETYLDLLLFNNSREIEKFEEQFKILKLLFQYGCHLIRGYPESPILEAVYDLKATCIKAAAINDEKELILLMGNAALNKTEYLEAIDHWIRIEALLKAHGAVEPQLLYKGPILQSFRYGFQNPEKIMDPLYYQLIASREGPHKIRKFFGMCEHPQYFFEKNSEIFFWKDERYFVWHYGGRFGQSRTILPDGSLILIGGEYEDSADFDFRIFNDVLKIDASGKMELYFYPTDVFPPTDFHTATFYEDDIIIVGSVGYPKHRDEAKTQVFRLKLADFRIEPMHTSGMPPKWLSTHNAIEREGKIIVWGGKVGTDYKDNLEIFSLDIKTGIWENHGLLGELPQYLTPWEEECEAMKKIIKARREKKGSMDIFKDL